MRVSKDRGAGSRQRGAQEPLDKALGCGCVSAHIHRQQAGPQLRLGDHRQE